MRIVGALPTLPQFEEYYVESKAMAAGQCNKTELWSQFTRAPGEVKGGWSIWLASGIFAQLFSKYILTQFGVVTAKLLDPLPFHSGLGELSSMDDAPHANDVVRFLKEQATPWFCIWGFLAAMCLLNMCYSAVVNVGLARRGEVEVSADNAWSLILVMVLLIVGLMAATYKIYTRFRSGALSAGKKRWQWRGRASRAKGAQGDEFDANANAVTEASLKGITTVSDATRGQDKGKGGRRASKGNDLGTTDGASLGVQSWMNSL